MSAPRTPLDTTTGARAVPARSTSLGRGGPENSRVFTPDKPLRTGTVRGPRWRCPDAPQRVKQSAVNTNGATS